MSDEVAVEIVAARRKPSTGLKLAVHARADMPLHEKAMENKLLAGGAWPQRCCSSLDSSSSAASSEWARCSRRLSDRLFERVLMRAVELPAGSLEDFINNVFEVNEKAIDRVFGGWSIKPAVQPDKRIPKLLFDRTNAVDIVVVT